MTEDIPDAADIEQVLNSTESGDVAEVAPQMSSFAVHLASYRSRQAAQTGWGELQGKYRSQLSGLTSMVREVNLGSARGTFYRLMAGPFASESQAETLCQTLKRSNQYCDLLRLDG